MDIPWTNIETYLKGTSLNLRQLHVLLFSAPASEMVSAGAAVAVALAGLLEQAGLSTNSALLGVRQVLPICDLVTETPNDLQVVNIMDGQYMTWRNCHEPFDLESGQTVSSYMPTVSTSIVLNRIFQSLVQC